jgi:polyisoprenoid-binding protein YceI
MFAAVAPFLPIRYKLSVRSGVGIMLRWIVVAALAFCAAPALAQDISKDPAKAPGGSYRLDPRHSQVLFAIGHIGLTDFHGRFDKLSGTLNFNPGQPEKSAVSVTIDTTSVDTPSHELNSVLQGEDVFSSEKFPSASFKSNSVTRNGSDSGRIAGTLTLRGISKPVALDVSFSGVGVDPLNGKPALGFRATARVKRTDFGITGMAWEPMVADEVTLTIEALFEQEGK